MNEAVKLMRAAQKKNEIRVEFTMEYHNVKVPAMLTQVDKFLIIERQDLVYKVAYVEYRNKGLDQEPIDEDEWSQGLEGLDPETVKQLNESKPTNLAQQSAQRIARMKTIRQIIPEFLKDPQTGKRIFTEQEDLDFIQEVICSNMPLMTQLTNKFGELLRAEKEVADKAKNSSKQESSKS